MILKYVVAFRGTDDESPGDSATYHRPNELIALFLKHVQALLTGTQEGSNYREQYIQMSTLPRYILTYMLTVKLLQMIISYHGKWKIIP